MADKPERPKSGASRDDTRPTSDAPVNGGDDQTVALDPGSRRRETTATDRSAEADAVDETVALSGTEAAPPASTRTAAGPPKPEGSTPPAAVDDTEETVAMSRTESAPPERTHTATAPPTPEPPGAPAAGEDADATVILAPGETAANAPTQLGASLPPGRPRLVIRGPRGVQQEFPLTKPDVAIGRASDCDVVLPAPTVSRLHARVSLRNGEHLLIPVGGHRNTYVNNELVTQPRLLHDGDSIQVASERLTYQVSETVLAAASGRRALAIGVTVGVVIVGLAVIGFYVRGGRTPSAPAGAPTAAPVPERAAAPVHAAGAEPAAAPPPVAAQAEPTAAEAVANAKPAEEQSAAAAEPGSQSAAAHERQERIAKLLYAGDVAFLEYRYTTPPEDSAVYSYREVLKIDPTNARALHQTAKIVDEYLTWAEGAVADGHWRQGRVYTDKAAYVHQQVPAAGDAAVITRRLDALGHSLASAK